MTNIKPVNILQPLNSKYPYVIQNSRTSYKNVSISGLLYGYDFQTTRVISRKSVIQQTEDVIKMLNGDNAICIKDWNGNIYIGRPSGDDSINTDLITGINRITFSIVEQGKYNNEEDLYENGLIRYD